MVAARGEERTTTKEKEDTGCRINHTDATKIFIHRNCLNALRRRSGCTLYCTAAALSLLPVLVGHIPSYLLIIYNEPDIWKHK